MAALPPLSTVVAIAAPPAASQSLAQAFASFSEAAASLETVYSALQAEVARLRRALDQSHRDLAARVEENERLRRRQALAEVAAVLAHEIRNPLGSLELFAGLLAESNLAAEERVWAQQLQAGLRTVAATVNNVLQFHSQPSPGLAPVDVNEFLRWLEQFLQPLAQRSRVRIEVDSSLEGVQIEADRHRLEQVMLNLALNSFHAMPGGGVLRIAAALREFQVHLEMADSGPGIAPQIREHIFAPGFSTRSGSPGLGLAVCKAIMEQHGGSIRVGSCAAGASFILEFPRPGVRA